MDNLGPDAHCWSRNVYFVEKDHAFDERIAGPLNLANPVLLGGGLSD